MYRYESVFADQVHFDRIRIRSLEKTGSGSRIRPKAIKVLRSRIVFMRLRVKISMRLRRLRLLPYCIARQNFLNELKFNRLLKLCCSFDYVRFVLVKIWTEWVINYKNTIVGAGAASCYSSGSDQKMLLRLRNTAIKSPWLRK
jgi:hypothetical protein